MKKTNREMFVALLSVIANADIADTDKIELTDFINLKIEQLDKKANTVSKAEREKIELNTKISQLIIDGLAEINEPIRVSELIKKYEPLNSFTTQKLTPIIVKLMNDGKIKKIASKRTVLYTVEVA